MKASQVATYANGSLSRNVMRSNFRSYFSSSKQKGWSNSASMFFYRSRSGSRQRSMPGRRS